MLRKLRFGLAIVAALGLAVTAAFAQNTVFFTNKGDVVLPLSPGGPLGTPMNFGADPGIVCASYYFTGTPAATDQVFFIATRALRVTSVSQIHSVAAGATSTLQVTKDTGTDAPGAGTDLLSTAFNLNATANTVQVGSLVTTAGVTTLAAGNRLAVDFANAIGTSAGVVVTACMAPM